MYQPRVLGKFRMLSTVPAAMLLASLLSISAANAHGATVSGAWLGSLTENGQKLAVRITLSERSGTYDGTFSSDAQAILDYPFDAVNVAGNHVAFVLGGGDIRFSGTALRARTITGTFDGDEGKGAFILHRAPAVTLPYRAHDVRFSDRGVILRGTLCVPDSPGVHPAVVLLHGSGFETRWGTNRFIADRLARNGIASLIYDKRGSGASGGDWRTVGYDALADDAIAGMTLLSKRADVDRRKIGLWGHSQGGFIAPLIAARSRHVAFIIAADSNASTNQAQDVLRIKNEIRDKGWTGRNGADALALYMRFLRVASAGGKGYGSLDRALQRESGKPWTSWIGVPPRSSWVYRWYPLVANYDSRAYWKNVRVPVLLIYGERDELSDVKGSIASIRALVRKAGGPPVTSIVLPDAPHTLHIAPGHGRPFFWWHMASGYPSAEIDWIRHVTRLER